MGQQVQVVDSDGGFNTEAVEEFLGQITDRGVKYTSVAIMGPQSSGKSTLLNSLFGTDFKMMNAEAGRHQTTKGIWLDVSSKIKECPTLVMDLEGSDGRERGEDDTTFERQSALFALAIADVLIINMFAVNIGRVQGAGAPLLKTVFQVNLKLFHSAPSSHKTVLCFVIRDRTRTPHEQMCATLRADLDAIWASLVKAPEYAESTVQDFFDLQYVSLPSYEEKPEEFDEDVTIFRRRFVPSHDTCMYRPDPSKVPAVALPLHMHEIWEVIRTQRDLDLPAHKVMVAHVRCKDIAVEQFEAISSDDAWKTLLDDATGDAAMPDFKSRAENLIGSAIFGYEQEAMYFVESVRDAERQALHRQLHEALRPAYDAQRDLRVTAGIQRFESELDDAIQLGKSLTDVVPALSDRAVQRYLEDVQANVMLKDSPYDAGDSLLKTRIQELVDTKRSNAVAAVKAKCTEELDGVVDGPVWMIVSALPTDLWAQLRSTVKEALKRQVVTVDKQLKGYGVPMHEQDALHAELAGTTCAKLVKSLRRHMQQLPQHLDSIFLKAFEEDDHGQPLPWNASLPESAARARRKCAAVLAQLTLVPTGFHVQGAETQDVAAAREAVLEFTTVVDTANSAAVSGEGAPALLTMVRWSDSVPQDAVLMTPADVRQSWMTLLQGCQRHVRRAVDLQEERKRASLQRLPIWVLPAIIFLGWNELMALVYSPLWLTLAILVTFFLYQLYNDLEVEAELQNGLPAAAISIAGKFVPVSQRIVARSADSLRNVVRQVVSDDTNAGARAQSRDASGAGSVEMSHVSSSPVEGLMKLRQRAAVQQE